MYARFTKRLDLRLRPAYRQMLEELAASSKAHLSVIGRDILEQSIERRHKRMLQEQKKREAKILETISN